MTIMKSTLKNYDAFYSSRRLYQYNEDDFDFNFGFYQAFKIRINME